MYTHNTQGHFEWSICDAADLDDPDGVVTQECFNMYPLTRAPDDGDASPIDPDYTGRYYVDPPCHLNETDQNFNKEGLLSSDSYPPYSVKMRYLLPDIECSHCVLRSYYFTGHRCKHIGYDEFNPPSWPSTCAPEKDDWVLTDIGMCGSTAAWYPEEFWNCAGTVFHTHTPPPPLGARPPSPMSSLPSCSPFRWHSYQPQISRSRQVGVQ
ncbi:unnamed protein product [Ectocarpus fasciculatus]